MKTAISILILLILACFKVIQHAHSTTWVVIAVFFGLGAIATLWLLLMVHINEPNIPEIGE